MRASLRGTMATAVLTAFGAACGSSFDSAPAGEADGGAREVGDGASDAAVGLDGGMGKSDDDGSTGGMTDPDAATGDDGSHGNDGDAVDAGCVVDCPRVQVGTAGGAVTNIAANDSFAFWIESGDLLRQVALGSATVVDAGSSAVQLSTPTALAVSADYAYVGCDSCGAWGNQSLEAIDLVSGATTYADSNGTTLSIALYGGSVYTAYNGAMILRYGAPLGLSTVIGGTNEPSNVQAANGRLFFIEGPQLITCPVAGCTSPVTLLSTPPDGDTYTVDSSGHLYWLSLGALYGCDVATNCTSTTKIASIGSETGLLADGAHVYWIDTTSPAGVYAASIDGANADGGTSWSQGVRIESGDDSWTALALNSTSLFWSIASGSSRAIVSRPLLK